MNIGTKGRESRPARDKADPELILALPQVPNHDGNSSGHDGGHGQDAGDRSADGPIPGHGAGANLTDEDLLLAYRRGDKNAFTVIVDRYQREIFHFLARFLGDRAAAEDVFQETFLQVHQSLGQFDSSRRFRPWLFTIAANKARDLIRSQSRRPTNPLQASVNPGEAGGAEFIDLMESAAALPSARMEHKEMQASVQKTLMEMPEHLREILLLSYYHQFPYKMIGEVLGIPLGTVKSRLHAAVAHFAELWSGTNPGQRPS